MDQGPNFEVKDISLANQGRLNIEWAESQMGALLKIRERFARKNRIKALGFEMRLIIKKEHQDLLRR